MNLRCFFIERLKMTDGNFSSRTQRVRDCGSTSWLLSMLGYRPRELQYLTEMRVMIATGI